MQALAAWLVSRPPNAILGLAVTLLLPLPPLTSWASSVVLTFLVLAQGTRRAITAMAIASVLLFVLPLIFGMAVRPVAELMLMFWVPPLLMVAVLRGTRSLTLTMQLSVILAVLAIAGFFIVVSDPAAYWQTYLDEMEQIAQANNLALNTDLLSPEVMTVSAVLGLWILSIVGLQLGYALYRKLPAETVDFGRFRDLNFGRVIAIVTGLVVLLAFLVDATWLHNMAFILTFVFWLQGLAIVHWLRAKGLIPSVLLVAVYVLLPLLQVLHVAALALIGYTDVWYGFRRRMNKT